MLILGDGLGEGDVPVGLSSEAGVSGSCCLPAAGVVTEETWVGWSEEAGSCVVSAPKYSFAAPQRLVRESEFGARGTRHDVA